MKKKPIVSEKCRRFVAATIRKYKDRLNVNNYSGTVTYAPEGDTKENGELVAGKIHVNRRYLNYNITLYPTTYTLFGTKSGRREIEEVIAHEVSHIVTQHMFEMATSVYKDSGEMNDAWESLTETVARLAMRIEK